jgi:UDP-N-acetylmuramoyl-tripeptide--D-alanyl-D-alanine ligase
VLASSGRKVLRNIKNYNNGLGHPLTVLNLARDNSYDIAVLEMGMSTPMNEIARLCRITPPDVAVELNVLPVHLEHLGSIENIAKAKAELVEGMKAGGVAVLNAEDPRVLDMKTLSRGTVLSYGTEAGADVTASDIKFASFGGTTFSLTTPSGSSDVSFSLNGKHNVLNALAAATVGHSFGMSARDIAMSLSSAVAPPQRGEIVDFVAGFRVINDSYNSNPAALLSMVRTLVDGGGNAKRKIVVAGEMLELGPDAGAIHFETGREIARSGIDMLIGVRGFASDLVAGAKEAGLNESIFAANSTAAGELLADLVAPGDAILIKGSRGVRTEKVLEVLSAKFEMEKSEAVKR